MDHVTFNAKSVQIFTHSIQYSDFTEDTHNTLTEQSKHQGFTSVRYKLGLILM